jgi:hypothetical protein
MRINSNKTKIMHISLIEKEPINITLNNQAKEHVKIFKYLGAIINSDGRCHEQIRTRITITKTAFIKWKELLTNGLHIDTKKKIFQTIKWSIVLYGSETWTLHKTDKTKIQAFEMWIWRRIQKISWQDRKTNKEVLESTIETWEKTA